MVDWNDARVESGQIRVDTGIIQSVLVTGLGHTCGLWSLEYKYGASKPSNHHVDWVAGGKRNHQAKGGFVHQESAGKSLRLDESDQEAS